jgi:hypothetical protein
MPKNKKNKAFIYMLLLCLLYMGGQQRVWGQDKFRTIYSWGTAIADTTPKRMLKDVGLSQVVEPQLPIIQKQERDRKKASFRSYTFYIDQQLPESVTLENLFTDYVFLLPPIYATDSLVLTDTIYNDRSLFGDLIAKKQFNNNGISYRYQQYHKGYKAGGMIISLIDGKVYGLGCGLPNLDIIDVTNVISIDEAVEKAYQSAFAYLKQNNMPTDTATCILGGQLALNLPGYPIVWQRKKEYLMPFMIGNATIKDGKLIYRVTFAHLQEPALEMIVDATTGDAYHVGASHNLTEKEEAVEQKHPQKKNESTEKIEPQYK